MGAQISRPLHLQVWQPRSRGSTSGPGLPSWWDLVPGDIPRRLCFHLGHGAEHCYVTVPTSALPPHLPGVPGPHAHLPPSHRWSSKACQPAPGHLSGKKSLCRMALNCFNFQGDSGNTWRKEKISNRTYIMS